MLAQERLENFQRRCKVEATCPGLSIERIEFNSGKLDEQTSPTFFQHQRNQGNQGARFS